MSVTPLDSTDQRLIQLVNELGDPLVSTGTLAEELSLGYEDALKRLEMLEEHSWIVGQSGTGEREWRVSSKASLLVRIDRDLPPDLEEPGEDVIDAEAADSTEEGTLAEEIEDGSETEE